ncbi:PqqD family peptide modification chaperone [Nocardia sp. NPDC052566]|uniref:PqqD family peptide modification chaperone n=1 Tax=Nocardia sp. NPDC052566 TaxID=3364330 RepID=UPI0037C6B9CD
MLILYTGDLHFSGWSMRGRITVREKQIPYVERFVELDWPTTENSDGVLVVGDVSEEREAHIGCQCSFSDLQALDREALLAGSIVQLLPRVPVLVDTDTGAVAADVVSIADYLDRNAPDSGPRLLGLTPAERAQILSLCAWASHDLSPLVYGATYAKSLRPQRISKPDQAAVEQADWVCDTVAALLRKSGGPFAVGEFSLVDVMLSTYFQQITGWGIAITDAEVGAYAHRLLQRPSVRSHLEEASHLYRAIAEAGVGSPHWIVRHYRYHPERKLLHDWQTDTCMRVKNRTAERIIELAYDGRSLDEIAVALARDFHIPVDRARDDVQRMLDQLNPTATNKAA